MNSFQNIVLGISIFLLILCLIIIAYGLYSKTYQQAFPPVVADCPDYWLDKSNGDSSNCENIKSLGTMTNVCKGPMNFSTEKWLGSAGLDRKQAWAKMCQLQWDGVTNTKLPRDNVGDSDDSDKKSWAKCSDHKDFDDANNEEESVDDEYDYDEYAEGGSGEEEAGTGVSVVHDVGNPPRHRRPPRQKETFKPFIQESLSKTATAVANS
tara:strand:+ start:2826 stop:3452 length:627 start_codon:yes stop_codon:yes gene_type:complete